MGSKTSNTSQVPNAIDPQLLFQRLILISEQQYIDERNIFKYELWSYPASLFEDFVLPRKANKSALALAIWSKVEKCKNFLSDESNLFNPVYVLDGGALLHRISWTVGELFSDICNKYTNYVLIRLENPPSSYLMDI